MSLTSEAVDVLVGSLVNVLETTEEHSGIGPVDPLDLSLVTVTVTAT